MPQTFHLFPLLPLELREEIWRFAIRLYRAEAYYVSLYDGVEDRDLKDVTSQYSDPREDEFSPWESQRWDITESEASPARRPGDTAREEQHAILTSGRWTLSKLSSNDSLWAVSKESRRIVDSVTKDKRWDAFDLKLESSAPAGPETVHGQHVRGALTVFPRHDLFYLQPNNLQTLPWERLDLSRPFDLPTAGSESLHHVALAFDFKWAIEMGKASKRGYDEMVGLDIVQNFVKAAYNARQDVKLWFVDYSLKRCPYVPTKEQVLRPDAQVFHAGDRRFVDTDKADYTGPWAGHWYQDDNCSFCDCASFVSEVESIINSIYLSRVEFAVEYGHWDDVYNSWEMAMSSVIDDGLVRPPPRLSFGILACESC